MKSDKRRSHHPRAPGRKSRDKIGPGFRVGHLTVIGTDDVQAICDPERRDGSRRAWPCRCDCGRHVPVWENQLLDGKLLSCGCAVGHRAEDLTGRRFGRLTVLGRADVRAFGDDPCQRAFWTCRCICGSIVVVRGLNLRSGNTSSCGCYKSEAVSRAVKAWHQARKGFPAGSAGPAGSDGNPAETKTKED